MAIQYNVVKMAQPGVKGGGSYKYYPRIHQRNKIGLKELANRISQKGTLQRSDVYGTLVALMDEIPELLKNNYNIRLGDIGILSVHATGTPADTEEEVTEKNIKKLHMAFRPGTDIKDILKTVDFKKIKKKQ